MAFITDEPKKINWDEWTSVFIGPNPVDDLREKQKPISGFRAWSRRVQGLPPEDDAPLVQGELGTYRGLTLIDD